ncbi:hypothetical protein SO802_006106 [Lithocarpus litseifolius]|uniref:Uncharacterized protein n=1 Tax=Lithocarpus litseifolius TaxID=425828 RepID=A0AAW2DK15_9ROSI
MAIRFNQDEYAPSSNPALTEVRVASLVVSLKVLTPRPKRTRSCDKGKDKIGAIVWEDATTTLGRAHSIVTMNELKVLGVTLHNTNEYLANEESVVLATSKVKAVEAKSLKLRKDLISLMDEANVVKGKLKALTDKLKVGKLLIVQKDE